MAGVFSLPFPELHSADRPRAERNIPDSRPNDFQPNSHPSAASDVQYGVGPESSQTVAAQSSELEWQQFVSETLAGIRTRELYILPEIPEKTEVAARQGCAVPSSETAIGVLDASAIGVATQAVVFGRCAVYFFHRHSGGGRLSYARIPAEEEIKMSGGALLFRIEGHPETLSVGGSSLSVAILRHALAELGSRFPPDLDC